jgi:hypothetical protein
VYGVDIARCCAAKLHNVVAHTKSGVCASWLSNNATLLGSQ